MEQDSWYIVKSSRMTSFTPYQGPTCDMAGVPVGKVYRNYDDAIADAKKLSACNPVGFIVKDMVNGTG